MPQSLLIDELTWREVHEFITRGWDSVIVPLGSTEQHGPALPLLTDSEEGVQTALRAARVVGRTLVGPSVTLGYSPEHVNFSGTISLSRSTIAAVIQDVAESHARSGFRMVYFWIGHGGNFPVLADVLPGIESRWPNCHVTGLRNLQDYVAKTWDKVPAEVGVPLSVSGSHAGEFEVSLMLALRPELVRMGAAEEGNTAPFCSLVKQMMVEGIHTVSPNGVLGDQRPADTQRGRLYLTKMVEYLVEDLKRERERMNARGSGWRAD